MSMHRAPPLLALVAALAWRVAVTAHAPVTGGDAVHPGDPTGDLGGQGDASILTAANPGPHDPALLLALSDFHRDALPSELAGFGPGLSEMLVAVATDDAVLRLARVRAIVALGDVNDDLAWETVTGLARNEAVHPRLRMAALFALGHRFDGREGREAALAEALRAPDPGLRRQAVESLAVLGTPEARAHIDGHRIAERDVAVRVVLRALEEAELGQSGALPQEGVAPERASGGEEVGR